MAARPEEFNKAPQVVVTWQNIFDPPKEKESIWGPVPRIISSKITVGDAHPFWPDIPRIDTEKAKSLFRQVLGNVFHKGCLQEHSNRQNAISFHVAPDSLDAALIKIDEIIRRVGLRYTRLMVDSMIYSAANRQQ